MLRSLEESKAEDSLAVIPEVLDNHLLRVLLHHKDKCPLDKINVCRVIRMVASKELKRMEMMKISMKTMTKIWKDRMKKAAVKIIFEKDFPLRSQRFYC